MFLQKPPKHFKHNLHILLVGMTFDRKFNKYSLTLTSMDSQRTHCRVNIQGSLLYIPCMTINYVILKTEPVPNHLFIHNTMLKTMICCHLNLLIR